MEIKNVSDKSFLKYGRILKELDTDKIIEAMKDTVLPEDVIYVPSDERLENLDIFSVFQNSIYGGLPVQIGYCNGHNNRLNALEYHRNSEINIASTDMVLLLGLQQDINEDYTYDTSKVEAFLVPQGTAVELYATTLHYAPCGQNNQGFKCVVVLPKGTNLSIDKCVTCSEDRLLAAANKWLIAHKEAGIDGAFIGLKGDNLTLDF